MTRITTTAMGMALALCTSAPATSAGTPVNLTLDAETQIGGVGVACAGIGQSKNEPRWLTYPLRIEFANDLREYLIGAEVTVSTMDQQQVMNVSCWGAWLLLKPPGRESYRVEARIITAPTAPPKSATVQAPASGQTRVVLEFPGVDG